MASGTSTIFNSALSLNSLNPTSATCPPTEAPSRLIRRRFATSGRVRSGCLTCKRRKKKCDDQRRLGDEWCQSCVRLGLVCERLPLRTVTSQKQKRKPDDNRGTRSEGTASAYDNVAGENTARDKEVSSCSAPVARGVRNSRDNVDNTDTDSLHPSPLLPPPSYCQTLSLNSGDGVITEFEEEPNNSFMALFALENASPERILLKYYIVHLAPLCSILQEGSNSFRNVLLPMAIDDSSLLYALFTYASLHLPSSGPVPWITPQMKMKFEAQVVSGLSTAIRLNSISESSVACALICSTAEVISGDTKRWLVHLQGAGHLIHQLGGPEKLCQTTDGQFLVRNFAYHDIMSAFSTGSRPRFRGTYWLNNSSSILADCLMGLGNKIIGHISDICFFMADVKEKDSTNNTTVFADSIIHEGGRLAQALRAQSLDPCTTLSNIEQDFLAHHAEAYRFAGLLHLYYFLGRYTAGATSFMVQISDCVQNIMRHVYQVPTNHSCEVGLVFPLFIAGVACADDDIKMAYIRDRLENIERWTKFQHVARICELLELLWVSGQTDWEALLQRLGWQISLA